MNRQRVVLCLSLLVGLGACTGVPFDPTIDHVPADAGGSAPIGGGKLPSSSGTKDGGLSIDPSGPVCGDGVADPKLGVEACDDGNLDSGDGCDASCTIETGYLCPKKGGTCVANCGDGMRRGDEACDDGNQEQGDGCTQGCQLEIGWACPTAGKACVAESCGDGVMVGDEDCDDGNGIPGDGCDDGCSVEAGYLCVGSSCSAAQCGDGIRAGAEACDDGNQTSGDGCLADCSGREPLFFCPVLGGTCEKITVCGDGIVTADEGCDDGNATPGDGCSPICVVEGGFLCDAGQFCTAVCGDGILAAAEQCDDGSQCVGGGADGTACSDSIDCMGAPCEPVAADGCGVDCALEPGFACDVPGVSCTVATCGNGIQEGLEQCDDGALAGDGVTPIPNNVLGDGCTPLCTREPNCVNGVCIATCGDGIVDDGEACDDKNNLDNDGCSATCVLESGFACSNITSAPPPCVDLPLVIRDFKARGSADGFGHPNFEYKTGDTAVELVRDRLGYDLDNDGAFDPQDPPTGAPAPVYAPLSSTTTTSNATDFNQWYHDSPLGKTVVSTMKVCDDPNDGRTGVYIFDDYTFYPLDGLGWQDSSRLSGAETLEPSYTDGSLTGCGGSPDPALDPDIGANHNFGFTSEVHFWFTYKGTEVLTFIGDDDVWVYINGYRVIDLGGVHCAESATVTLSDIAAVSMANLVVGKVYGGVVYQAERHTTMSTYRLELGDFVSQTTECVSVCGDGFVTGTERCDDGSACVGGAQDGKSCQDDTTCTGGSCVSNNDGGYGHCNPDCSGRGHYCGDGTVDAQEQCDLGSMNNDGTYNGCNPDCTLGPRCGDGNADGFFGEQCDQGSNNKNGVYGACTTSCLFGPRCGDAVVQSKNGETCDDGVNLAVYDGCAPGCVAAPRCGDGVVQSAYGETCDDGDAGNKGAYGGCTAVCLRAPYCGNGVVDGPKGVEQCDDGNTNSFDGCSSVCLDETVLK